MTMHAIPDNRAVSHATRTLPAPAMSAADKAARLAATGPIRVHAGDSDMDEALYRLQTEIAYIERDAQLDAEVAQDIAAKDNWIPYVPPATRPRVTAAQAAGNDGYWDAVIDGNSLAAA